MIKNVMDDKFGSVLISVILGLGLAALFRRACHGDSCMVVKSPPLSDLRKYTYRMDSQCYKYSPEVVPCPWPKSPGGGLLPTSPLIPVAPTPPLDGALIHAARDR